LSAKRKFNKGDLVCWQGVNQTPVYGDLGIVIDILGKENYLVRFLTDKVPVNCVDWEILLVSKK
jgi:hypothetical protein